MIIIVGVEATEHRQGRPSWVSLVQLRRLRKLKDWSPILMGKVVSANPTADNMLQ